MCKSYKIALNEIHRTIESQEPFALENLYTTILDKGGVLRVESNFTILQYLKRLQQDGLIFYNPCINKYEVMPQYLAELVS